MLLGSFGTKTVVVALASALLPPVVVEAQVRRSKLSKEDREIYDRLTKELENGDKDPGADWNTRNANPSLVPTISSRVGAWHWGELVYGKTYSTYLTVTNRCDTPETISIFTHNLSYLKFPRKVRVAGGEAKKVPMTITMPPEPPPPFVPPGGTPPAWGWVPPPLVPNAGGAKFHQPNFADIAKEKGEVILWHPLRNDCRPERTTYDVTGHIHFGPPDDSGGPSGPEKIASPDVCEVYWLTGEPPAQLDGEDCTDEMRSLASRWRETVVQPYVDSDPGAWGWLPEASHIEQMSIDDLLEMKRRADTQMREP